MIDLLGVNFVLLHVSLVTMVSQCTTEGLRLFIFKLSSTTILGCREYIKAYVE